MLIAALRARTVALVSAPTLQSVLKASLDAAAAALPASPRTACRALAVYALQALVIVVTVKYHVYVLRADNHGEGGILALMALIPARIRSRGKGVLPKMKLRQMTSEANSSAWLPRLLQRVSAVLSVAK